MYHSCIRRVSSVIDTNSDIQVGYDDDTEKIHPADTRERYEPPPILGFRKRASDTTELKGADFVSACIGTVSGRIRVYRVAHDTP